MSVRLAFSVAIQVDADILLIDEVLAVGDAAFQQKCFEQFEQLKAEGKTIVFVTHDMGAVERFCDRAMLIERGRMHRRSASPHEIAPRLQRAQLRPARRSEPSTPRAATATRPRPRSWPPGSRTTRASAIDRARPGRAAARRASRSSFHDRVERPGLRASHLRNEPRHDVFATSTRLRRRRDRQLRRRRDRRTCACASRTGSRPSRYTLTPVGRARRHAAPTRSTCARTSPRSIVHGDAHDRRRRRPPARRSRSSACERHAPLRAARRSAARRRPRAASGSLTWTLAVDRLQAALLRLGARLRCGRWCGRSRSSASSTSSSPRSSTLGNGVKNYAVYILVRDRAVPVLRGGRRAAAVQSPGRRARTCCARSASRAW